MRGRDDDVGATLNAAAMLARAQAETGLTDYGDPTLPERFGLAVEHLNGTGMDADGMQPGRTRSATGC